MSETEPEKPFPPRWARYLLIPGLVGPALVLVFIIVTEVAHDESRCPYTRGESRPLDGSVSVREDRRNCLWDVEDRRYSVVRGSEEHPLGRRRFRAAAFSDGRYSWKAELSKGEVHVRVKNDGHNDAVFREGTEEERRQN